MSLELIEVAACFVKKKKDIIFDCSHRPDYCIFLGADVQVGLGTCGHRRPQTTPGHDFSQPNREPDAHKRYMV